MLAAALLLVAAIQPPPPLAGLAPEDRAATLAVSTFAFGCLQRLGAAASAADFARDSDALGAKLAQDYPDDRAAFQVDGAAGRGCRVRYTGPRAERLWKAFSDVVTATAPTPDGGGCVPGARSDLHLRAVCTDTGPKPPRRAELDLDRSGAGPIATLTASLLFPAP